MSTSPYSGCAVGGAVRASESLVSCVVTLRGMRLPVRLLRRADAARAVRGHGETLCARPHTCIRGGSGGDVMTGRKAWGELKRGKGLRESSRQLSRLAVRCGGDRWTSGTRGRGGKVVPDPLGILFPAVGTPVPKVWYSCSQPVGNGPAAPGLFLSGVTRYVVGAAGRPVHCVPSRSSCVRRGGRCRSCLSDVPRRRARNGGASAGRAESASSG